MAGISLRKPGTSLYAQVVEHLERAITTGSLPIGKQLPSEAELQKRYGVSKFTVREALRRLEADGLVHKRHGVGTCVIAKSLARRSGYAIEDIDDFMSLAHRARLTRLALEHRAALPHERTSLGLDTGEHYAIISGVRRLPGSRSITAYVKVYVPHQYTRVTSLAGSEPHLVSDLIEQQFGVVTTAIRQAISAPVLDRRLREEIKKAGITGRLDRALLFRRWHLDHDEELVMCSENLFVDPGFTFHFTLARQGLPQELKTIKAQPHV